MAEPGERIARREVSTARSNRGRSPWNLQIIFICAKGTHKCSSLGSQQGREIRNQLTCAIQTGKQDQGGHGLQGNDEKALRPAQSLPRIRYGGERTVVDSVRGELVEP